jgi:hypothetical protein
VEGVKLGIRPEYAVEPAIVAKKTIGAKKAGRPKGLSPRLFGKQLQVSEKTNHPTGGLCMTISEDRMNSARRVIEKVSMSKLPA